MHDLILFDVFLMDDKVLRRFTWLLNSLHGLQMVYVIMKCSIWSSDMFQGFRMANIILRVGQMVLNNCNLVHNYIKLSTYDKMLKHIHVLTVFL